MYKESLVFDRKNLDCNRVVAYVGKLLLSLPAVHKLCADVAKSVIGQFYVEFSFCEAIHSSLWQGFKNNWFSKEIGLWHVWGLWGFPHGKQVWYVLCFWCMPFQNFYRLLDILADRKDPAGLSGLVRINGQPLPSNFKRLSGYVVQVLQITTYKAIRNILQVIFYLSIYAIVCSDF